MKATIILLSILSSALLLFETGKGQSLTSPFVYLCRRTCGGYGVFRRLCCMVDDVCCTKPNECPENPTENVLIRMCQRCTNDVDCMFTSKCCESEGKKCCTSVRSSMFRKSGHQRAKVKSDSISNSTVNLKMGNATEEMDRETEM